MMQQTYPGINSSISEWKGQEITDFQEELRIRVNARISEKWFYTHFKSGKATLPRIDMLNLLSRYAGYVNWDDFVFRNRADVPRGTEAAGETRSANRMFFLVPVLALIVVLLLYGLFRLFNTREYTFTFYDADTQEPITLAPIRVILLREGESPVMTQVPAGGTFRLKTDQSRLKMVVKAPYYHEDTIVRMVRKLDTEEKIMLHADDYAMVLHYYSMSDGGDWIRRREKLETMFGENAVICQLMGGKDASGMALFNKKEFIDRLTMPAGSLRNIEILESRMVDGKIRLLKFRINEKNR